MKKVISVTGTGRSGSTLLDLMLGNGPNSFSMGEVYALFWPRHPQHLLSGGCMCEDKRCDFWSSLKRSGEEQLYNKLFGKLDVDILVDSSKHPLWLRDQINTSKERNYSLVPVLIYKSPIEFAYSLDKRGSFDRWRTMWVRRHRWLFRILNNFVSVRYKNIATSPAKLIQDLCRNIGIEYFQGKEEFWNADTQHFLLGSSSVKKADRIVYYEDQFEEERLKKVKEKIEINHTVEKIWSVLEARSVWGEDIEEERIDNLQSELSGVNSALYIYRMCKTTKWYWVNRMLQKMGKGFLNLRS